MAGDEIRAVVDGVKELQSDMEKLDRDVFRATRAGAQKSGRLVATSVKKQIQGPPRYGERGKSRIYPETTHVKGATGPREGGPGKFTGSLRKGVHSGRPKGSGDSVVVQVKGSTGVSNLYASRVDGSHPYFKAGVDKALPLVRETFNSTYRSALIRYSER